MSLTRPFRKTVLARINTCAAFRAALQKEAIDALRTGEVEVGKSLIRDCNIRWVRKASHATPRRRQGR
jgi:hypothetical protein